MNPTSLKRYPPCAMPEEFQKMLFKDENIDTTLNQNTLKRKIVIKTEGSSFVLIFMSLDSQKKAKGSFLNIQSELDFVFEDYVYDSYRSYYLGKKLFPGL
jgi:hypothetical protein